MKLYGVKILLLIEFCFIISLIFLIVLSPKQIFRGCRGRKKLDRKGRFEA